MDKLEIIEFHLQAFIIFIAFDIVGKLSSLKQLDYDYSLKIASILSYDSPWRTFLRIVTFTGTAFTWIAFILLWYIFEWTPREESTSIGFIFLFMLAPIFIIKQTIRRPRPDFKDTRGGAVIMDEWSFPSGHASRSTYVMLLMPVYTPAFLIFWILWGILMIASRLLLGVHYISDIIGGIIITSFFIGMFYLLDILPEIPWAIY